MERIQIPFLAEFEGVMLTGKKTATSRTKRYGWPDDYFEAFGRQYTLISVSRLSLARIRWDHYLDEGLNSDYEFVKIWERLHPRKGFVADQVVYFHCFRLQVDMCPFHVHELTDNGACRICGCVPLNEVNDD